MSGDNDQNFSKHLSLIEILLNDPSLTKEKLMSAGASKLAEWDGDDKNRDISLDEDYIMVTRGRPDSRCHSIIFRKNGDGYYKPETYKV